MEIQVDPSWPNKLAENNCVAFVREGVEACVFRTWFVGWGICDSMDCKKGLEKEGLLKVDLECCLPS